MIKRLQQQIDFWLLLLLILTGGFLRFYNLNWDQGHYFHPDERNIAAAVSRIHFFDQTNPRFFAYGSLPIYLYRITGEIIALAKHDQSWVFEWSKINLIGRGTSAFFSTASILLAFLLGKKIKNRQLGILGAFFVALTPSLIQTAHFSVTESLLAFWSLLITLTALKLLENSSFKNYYRLGIIFGLSVATKISALSFLSVIGASHFLSHPKIVLSSKSWFRKFSKHQFKLLSALLVALILFSLISPYTYLDWSKFRESINYESGVVYGRLRVVYVLQFEKTLAYFFQIRNLFWQMGLVAEIGILGLFFLLFKGLRKRNKKVLIFLSFPIAYFFYAGSWHTKFIRYLVPLLPFLAITAAWFLLEMIEKKKTLGLILTTFFCLTSLFWSLAFFSIYTRQSTRIAASEWIYKNIFRGAKILTEHWDDGLPVETKSNHPSQYEQEQLTIYEPDNKEKVNYYAQKLSQFDYLIINSRRLYGTLINLPEKYPLTSHYYKLLFAEKLGYQKVAEFTSYPSFLGLEINDDTSEETFQIYDHPKVIVFRNIQKLDKQKLVNILLDHYDQN